MATHSGGSPRGILRWLTTTGFLLMGLLFAAEAGAQGMGGMMNASPEERAAQRIGLLTERLTLTPEQVEKIQPMLVKQYTEQVELFRKAQGGGGDRQAIMGEMRDLRTRYDEQILAVLTDAQKTAYQALQQEERERRMNRMNGGGGGGGR